jgi:hypothetical protein
MLTTLLAIFAYAGHANASIDFLGIHGRFAARLTPAGGFLYALIAARSI